jgi:hypothetical protein
VVRSRVFAYLRRMACHEQARARRMGPCRQSGSGRALKNSQLTCGKAQGIQEVH